MSRLYTITVPGPVAVFLEDLEDVYDEAADVRDGEGHEVVVTATAAVHHDIADRAEVLAGGDGCDAEPEETEAYNRYVHALEAAVRR
ncbi:hypothetical protein AB0I84_45430 [Streptomyces spectabilis]|uniref:hypothetical protein n=1 Tax=Streptomyces spectabilis TaxID=68270 RepID=UPI0033D605A6